MDRIRGGVQSEVSDWVPFKNLLKEEEWCDWDP